MLIKHGEKVSIERAKPQLSSRYGKGGGKAKSVNGNKPNDTIVRFRNSHGEEVGRLELTAAAWVSSLMDQKLCEFEGHCVFAPDRIRVNDTMYLQLHCFFVKTAFDADKFVKPKEDNRQTGIFEARETAEERDLHLRQVALVKLFDEIKMIPSRSTEATQRHKRQGLLQAAEVAEHYDAKPKIDTTNTKGDETTGSSPPPPSEDVEDREELKEDQLDTLYRKAQSFDFNTPEYEPAATFAMDLRKYQKQALHWMVGKEKDEKTDHKEQSMHPLWEEYLWPTKDVDDKPLATFEDQTAFYVNPYSGELSTIFPVQEQNCLGGVLADEMGLGKTIEMLSLIHSHKSEIAEQISSATSTVASVNDLPRMSRSANLTEWAPCTTLVVAPMSLIAQWESEAEKASRPGTLKVQMYYGADKTNLRYLCCAANAAHAPNVIITSYGIVLSEFSQIASAGGDRAAHNGLFSLEYFRIILDEAHSIKNRQSKTAKACYELAALHRWVLTGTPIVNRLEDLFSLVHFLRVEPWSNFSFWKTFITMPFESGDYIKALDVVQTVLEPLVLRRTKDMKTPEGEALVPLPTRTINVERLFLSKEEREVYDYIFNRAKRTFAANVEAGTLMKSYTTIFAQILRLRQSCCHPVLTRNASIVADEEDAAAAADLAAGLGDDMDLQALIARFSLSEDEGEQDANRFGAHALQQIQEGAEAECPVCAEEPMIEQAVTSCWHSACKQCLIDYITHQTDKGEVARCFSCREPVNARDVFEVVRHADAGDDRDTEARVSLRRIGKPSSAKISALLAHLTALRRTEPAVKSVVFSQFTAFLDLIEPALRAADIKFLRLDGSMAQKARAAVLAAFAEGTEAECELCDEPSASRRKAGVAPTRPTVLLLSLRAGGVGLNLTAASRVFMMDPWWSWAVEAQAVDRVHRMGQTREVQVTRFVCEESIEEKMLRIQERKKFM